MTQAYDIGQAAALNELGLTKLGVAKIPVKQRKDPYAEIHRRIRKAFRLKMPKFDMSKLMKRLLTNPLRQPQKQLSGKTPPLKV